MVSPQLSKLVTLILAGRTSVRYFVSLRVPNREGEKREEEKSERREGERREEEKSEEGRREGERRERICFRERRGVKKRKERRRKWTLDALVLKSHW